MGNMKDIFLALTQYKPRVSITLCCIRVLGGQHERFTFGVNPTATGTLYNSGPIETCKVP